MEHIKQALEKARLERQTSRGAAASPPRSGSADISAPIRYTHTRTVNMVKSILQERRIISGFKQNAFTDAYKMLRTQVLQRLRENGWNSLAVTSPGLNEGKTLTAINLAISIAMEVNYTVLLVDADLRHPSVHSYFGIEAECGLSDYLMADKPLSELLIHPEEIPSLVILPGGKPLANSAEMLNSPKMARLVEELKTRYSSRIILFDLPPLLGAADALAFSPYVDAALLVIEHGKTRAEDVKRAVGLLQGTSVIGTVLNKSWANVQQEGGASWMWPARLRDAAQLFRAAAMSGFNRLRRRKN
jgi:exopolysaccharide/PEP-CTERM locus tyrosine autokinase